MDFFSLRRTRLSCESPVVTRSEERRLYLQASFTQESCRHLHRQSIYLLFLFLFFPSRRCRKAIPVATSAYLENLPSHYTQNVHLNQVSKLYLRMQTHTDGYPPPRESLLFTTTYYTSGGSREGAWALIFRPNCGGRVGNNFWRPPPPLPALYLEVWIWHRVQFKF